MMSKRYLAKLIAKNNTVLSVFAEKLAVAQNLMFKVSLICLKYF